MYGKGDPWLVTRHDFALGNQAAETFNLIENDAWSLIRENKESGKYGRNGYLSLNLFSPIYSALAIKWSTWWRYVPSL